MYQLARAVATLALVSRRHVTNKYERRQERVCSRRHRQGIPSGWMLIPPLCASLPFTRRASHPAPAARCCCHSAESDSAWSPVLDRNFNSGRRGSSATARTMATHATEPSAYLFALGRHFILGHILQHHVDVDIKAAAAHFEKGRRGEVVVPTHSSRDKDNYTLLPAITTCRSVPTISLSPRRRIQILLPTHRSTSSDGSRWLGLL